MHTADVVLIGGGIVGSSLAYHLVAAGCKNGLVIERETTQGKGSTGKSMGGVRAQFSTPINIHLAYLRANYRNKSRWGLKNVRLVAGAEIRGMFPELRGDDIVGGSFVRPMDLSILIAR